MLYIEYMNTEMKPINQIKYLIFKFWCTYNRFLSNKSLKAYAYLANILLITPWNKKKIIIRSERSLVSPVIIRYIIILTIMLFIIFYCYLIWTYIGKLYVDIVYGLNSVRFWYLFVGLMLFNKAFTAFRIVIGIYK